MQAFKNCPPATRIRKRLFYDFYDVLKKKRKKNDNISIQRYISSKATRKGPSKPVGYAGMSIFFTKGIPLQIQAISISETTLSTNNYFMILL